MQTGSMRERAGKRKNGVMGQQNLQTAFSEDITFPSHDRRREECFQRTKEIDAL